MTNEPSPCNFVFARTLDELFGVIFVRDDADPAPITEFVTAEPFCERRSQHNHDDHLEESPYLH